MKRGRQAAGQLTNKNDELPRHLSCGLFRFTCRNIWPKDDTVEPLLLSCDKDLVLEYRRSLKMFYFDWRQINRRYTAEIVKVLAKIYKPKKKQF